MSHYELYKVILASDLFLSLENPIKGLYAFKIWFTTCRQAGADNRRQSQAVLGCRRQSQTVQVAGSRRQS